MTLVQSILILALFLISSFGCSREEHAETTSDAAVASSSASTVLTPTTSVTTPTVTPVLSIMPLKAEVWQVKPVNSDASSDLTAADKNDYSASRAFDGKSGTAWCEGNDGIGKGEWLEFTLAPGTQVDHLVVATGFDKQSPAEGNLFVRNAHVKKLRVVVDNSEVAVVNVKSSERSVTIPIGTHAVTVHLEFLEVWPPQADGNRRAFDDLCINEIRVFAQAK